MNLYITVCVALIGGYLGLKMHIPAGALIGSMIAAALLNVGFDTAYMPSALKFYTQVTTGTFIGAKICKGDLKNLKTIFKPALLLVVIMILFAVSTGLIIHAVSDLSISTALFAMAPAGIADMTLAAMDFDDSEPSMVALIQTLRLIFTICVLPPLIKRITRSDILGSDALHSQPPLNKPHTWKNLIFTLLIGLVCGTAGKYSGIPGGTIAFSMMGSAAFNVLTARGYMPLRLRQVIQVFSGALIGCTVGRDEIEMIADHLVIISFAIISFILLDLVAAKIIVHFFYMHPITALFSCAPGGVTDMALIAEDMGADRIQVAGMHTLRLIGVISLYPFIIHCLIHYFL